MTLSSQQETTENFAMQPEASTSMPQHGSTSEDGKQTGWNRIDHHLGKLRTTIEGQMEEANQLVKYQPPSKPKSSQATVQAPKEVLPTLRESPKGQVQVLDLLEFCWKSLHLYGKKPDDFAGIQETYLAFLSNYEVGKITKAFEKYIRTRTIFPAPADIIGIIEGRIKKDPAIYRNLLAQRRAGAYLMDEEKEYIRKYERQTLNDWE